MGAGDYLQNLWNALKGQGGQAQPPAGSPGSSVAAGAQGTPPGAPGASPPPASGATPPTSGLGGTTLPSNLQPGILDNPMLQGALSAYLGAIGSPRSRGLGGAISAGGLSGLNAYEQARSNLLAPYLTAAKLGETQASTFQKTAQGQKDIETTKEMPGLAEATKHLKTEQANLASTRAALAPGDSEARRALDEADTKLKNALASGEPAKIDQAVAEAQNLRAQASKVPSEIGRNIQQTAESQARTQQLIPAQAGAATAAGQLSGERAKVVGPEAEATIAERKASAARQQAETAAMPILNNLRQAQAALDQARTLSEPGRRVAAQALAEKNLRAAYDSQKHIGQDAWNATVGAYYPGAKWGQSYEDFKKAVMSGAATGSAGAVPNHPDLPPGWKQDPRNPNGAWDEKGTYHINTPD